MGGGGSQTPSVEHKSSIDFCNPDNFVETDIAYHTGETAFASAEITTKTAALAAAQFVDDDFSLVVVDGNYTPVEELPGGLYVEATEVADGLDIELITCQPCDTNCFSFLLDVDENLLGVAGVDVGPAIGDEDSGLASGLHVDEGIYNYVISSGENLKAGTVGTIHLQQGLKVPSTINVKHDINRPDIFDITTSSPCDGLIRWEEFNIGDADNNGTVTPLDIGTLQMHNIHWCSSVDNAPPDRAGLPQVR